MIVADFRFIRKNYINKCSYLNIFYKFETVLKNNTLFNLNKKNRNEKETLI